MNTFLPYPDFAKCAKVLDNKRIGKQIIECQQIFKAITDPTYGWQNHPAVDMWRGGFEVSLFDYAHAMDEEWSARRGKSHGAWLNLIKYVDEYNPTIFRGALFHPEWLGDERLHSSHRSNLLRKDPEWYGQFGWTESPDMPYFWPTKELA